MVDAAMCTDPMIVDLARECLYRFLAAAFSDPWTQGHQLIVDPVNQRLAQDAADLLRAEVGTTEIPLGLGELPPEQLDLKPLLAELRLPADELRAESERVFGLVLSRECPPYETEYHPSSETFFRAQQLADIAGFYRAFGLETSVTEPDRPDSLALELEFMAFLLLKKRLAMASIPANPSAAEDADTCDRAKGLFFRDHLAWWVPAFATGLRRKAGGGFYSALGQVLAALLPLERARFGVEVPRMPLQAALIERPEEQAGCAACPAIG